MKILTGQEANMPRMWSIWKDDECAFVSTRFFTKEQLSICRNKLSELIGVCPYCGPNYSDIPNLLESVRGYDMAHGNPFPGKKALNILSSRLDFIVNRDIVHVYLDVHLDIPWE